MGEETLTALDTVSLWRQGKEAAVRGGISKSWHIPQPMESFRKALTASLLWRRRTCSKAGLPCCTVRGRGHDGCISQGWPKGCEAGCAGRGAQGCPSEQGPFTPGGCVLGQGLCRLPGSALSLPGELPTGLWGEGVGGRSDLQQGRVLLLLRECCMGRGCSQLQLTPVHFQGNFPRQNSLKGKVSVF